MSTQEMIDLLNNDLKNEWKHHNFYLHNASTVCGLHASEYKEFLLAEAASEMQHITEFSDLIVGLGGTPITESNEFPSLCNPQEILEYALKMEVEVVENYVNRIGDAEVLGGVDGYWIIVFLENQIEHSRTDVDKLRQITKKLGCKKC